MNISKIIQLLLTNKKALLLAILDRISFLVPDEPYLKLQFKLRMGYSLNLENPQSFSEKIQWLKLNDKNPLYTKLVDKYEVKTYVMMTIGQQYIIPTIGIWDDVASIQWDALPERFVLKTTQGGGSYGVIICKNKTALDKKHAETEK